MNHRLKRVGAAALMLYLTGAWVVIAEDATDRIEDYRIGVEKAAQVADYVTINISSPNTPGLRALQSRAALDDLLGRVGAQRAVISAAHGAKPLFLKIAPDLSEGEIRDVVEGAIAGGVDALEWESERSREGLAARSWLRTKANSIEGGTSEVMLNVIAKRILELPGVS